jgi:hypothetical protein
MHIAKGFAMLKKRNKASWFALIAAPILCLNSPVAFSGQQMKCVDGSGRVLYTDLSSCAEAFRANPTPTRPMTPSRAKANALKAEFEKLNQEEKALNQQIKDRRYKEKLESDYRERQRLMAEEERRQSECAAMLIESDKRYKEAQQFPYDGWWQARSINYDNDMEAKCGHEVRLRR